MLVELNEGIDVGELKGFKMVGLALSPGECSFARLAEGVPVGQALGLDDGSFVGLDERNLEGLTVGWMMFARVIRCG